MGWCRDFLEAPLVALQRHGGDKTLNKIEHVNLLHIL